MTLNGPDVRTLQIHPTRHNLRCIDRYSSSGLRQRGELGAPLLIHAVRDAAELGYNALSLCGEPLLYESLPALCREAYRLGMLTTLLTSGGLLTPRNAEELRGSVDVVAISLEAVPGEAAPAASAQALPQLAAGLDLLRRAGISFAFVFTATRANLEDLDRAAAYAAAEGALLLQVRPAALTARQLSVAWMRTEYLRQLHQEKLAIYLDAVNRYDLPDSATLLREAVSPLVVEEDGTVVPLRYGFPRSFALGSLQRRTLAEMLREWPYRCAAGFAGLYRETVAKLRQSDSMFVNLYEAMAQEARTRGVVLAGAAAGPVLLEA